MHFSIIKIPDKTVFDEVHYVTDARGVISGSETVRGEHPPLGKLFVIAGMLIFGDNPLGWRFFSVILSAISIVLFYFICRNLSMSKRASFLATFLLAFENLTFVFSGMAMLDVYCLTFTLAAFWLYLRGNYPLSGIMVALSALAKLNGALAIFAILLHWLIVRRDKIWEFFGLMVFTPVFFVFLMPFCDLYLFHKWTNPVQRIWTMLKGSASLTFANVENTYAQRPWEWIFRLDLTPYTFNPNYLAVVSYTVTVFIIPIVIYMIVKTIKNSDAGFFGLLWFASTYLMWIPIVFITDRVTYPFYIYQSIGAICIGLGIGLSQLIRIFEVRRNGKFRWGVISFVVIYLLAHLAFFYIMSPLSYWWGTPVFNGVT
jgi:dolichyl-phosphate-mannose-protein mannosyltransferase